MVGFTKKSIVWCVSTIFGLVLLFAFAGPFIPRKEVRNWICPVSGSTRTETRWFGFFEDEKRTVTALEKWLELKEAGFTPRWQHLSTQTYFLLGRSCGTAGAPEIYQLIPYLDQVVEMLSDEQIARLVSVLRNGSEDQKRKMLEKVTDQVFDESNKDSKPRALY